ncbi:50S ribosomal protein L21 [Profundibacterium mesophilum]|uniref:Large ribosomal subunit protein bL21 n=1 Tax=Profundibacterium mesophilum KAUST100406-0324 TaxID=1037889 RepID=A0A921NU06_9RHOB|nr:50S ribosomal protein L21 [Profundibacterium mesophilum]KAF0675176.1 50S ribosomal protein L21 [Profundibacterium mesophilum KAUST100406-0324]
MFAVLKTGGKQYRVQSGDVLRVEKLAAEAGEKVQFNDILMIGGTVGVPLVEGAGVQAEVIEQIKGEKVIHFVKRRRKHGSQRTKGHRQQLTLLRVTDLLESGAGDSGVKAAVGTGGTGRSGARGGRYAMNATQQAEMKQRVATGGAGEKAAEADDMKKLKGVGPKMAETMIAQGVTTFAQIAGWSDADVAEWDEKLGTKGKIEKDDWVAQAKSLSGE